MPTPRLSYESSPSDTLSLLFFYDVHIIFHTVRQDIHVATDREAIGRGYRFRAYDTIYASTDPELIRPHSTNYRVLRRPTGPPGCTRRTKSLCIRW